MKFYLDTASVKEIQEAASLGLLDGVTTNPSLVAKEGRVFREVLVEICNIVDGPISAEVVSIEADAMVKEGRELAKIHKNIVVKVPLIAEGLKATKRLAAEGIKVNVTLCFSPTQALLAAKAGAWCVSPFAKASGMISRKAAPSSAPMAKDTSIGIQVARTVNAMAARPADSVPPATLAARIQASVMGVWILRYVSQIKAAMRALV